MWSYNKKLSVSGVKLMRSNKMETRHVDYVNGNNMKMQTVVNNHKY